MPQAKKIEKAEKPEKSVESRSSSAQQQLIDSNIRTQNLYSSLIPTFALIPFCQLCPYGTYKSNSGDDFNMCLPCNENNSISMPNRVNCLCTTVLQNDYIAIYNKITNDCNIIETIEAKYLNNDELLYEHNSSFTRYQEFECEKGYYFRKGVSRRSLA